MRKGMLKLGAIAFMVAGGLGASSTPPIYANQLADNLTVEVTPFKIPRAYGRVVAVVSGNHLVFEATDGTIRVVVWGPHREELFVYLIYRD